MTQSTVEIALMSDGTATFGARSLGATIDTTANGGVDDVQVVRVVQGPASLYIKSTAFSDGLNTWALGAVNGPNQAVWQFSVDGLAYTTMTQPNTLSLLAPSVPVSGTVNVYFRLTMPTATSSNNQHSATVTIVAVSP